MGLAHIHLLVFPFFSSSFFFFFYLSFFFTLHPPSPSPCSTRHFAVIQLCICILNDSITRDPAVKITDVFHYFSPLGHADPSLAPITNPPLTRTPPTTHPSSPNLPPPVLFFPPSPIFPDKRLFCCAYLRREEIIAKWSCL